MHPCLCLGFRVQVRCIRVSVAGCTTFTLWSSSLPSIVCDEEIVGADGNLCRCYRTWIFPFAQTVLRYEKLLHPKEATKARNRCGEANQGDVAAMTDAEIKKAKFFIVDVSDSIHSSLDRAIPSIPP